MTDSQLSLCIVLPAKNEEKNLRSVVIKLRENFKTYLENLQMIIVNDGSTDTTGEVAEKLSQEFLGISVLHNPQSLGLGGAYKSALPLVHADFVTWLPADGEITLQPFDLGERLHPNKVLITYPKCGFTNRNIFRRLASRMYTRWMNFLFGLDLTYFNGSAFYPSEFLKNQKTQCDGFFFNAEILVKALKLKSLSYEEIPFIYKERSHGESKALRVKTLWHVIHGTTLLISEVYLRRKKKRLAA